MWSRCKAPRPPAPLHGINNITLHGIKTPQESHVSYLVHWLLVPVRAFGHVNCKCVGLPLAAHVICKASDNEKRQRRFLRRSNGSSDLQSRTATKAAGSFAELQKEAFTKECLFVHSSAVVVSFFYVTSALPLQVSVDITLSMY